MILIYLICLCVIGSYFLLILAFIIGFGRLENNTINHESHITFSVIIPFRNEAKYLPGLLDSISKLAYDTSLFEVLLVDDGSTDNSIQIIESFKQQFPQLIITVLKNNRYSNSPKKDAISTAIKHTTHNWVISTDADCIVPQQWLKSYSDFINTYNPNMVVAPVSFIPEIAFLKQFQHIDFLSMQGATIGGFGMQQPFMANGANLAYKKELFLKLNGFENNNTIASGDDVFLLENFIAYKKEKTLFLKDRNALVTTFPVETWRALINQRKRWAAKATHFSNVFTKIVGVLVFLANCSAILSMLMLVYNYNFIWLFLLKVTIDTVLIFKTSKLYQHNIAIAAFLKTIVFYPFFTAFVALSSLTTTFEWKGRAFKK